MVLLRRAVLSSILVASACQQLQAPPGNDEGGNGSTAGSDEGGTFLTSADSSGGGSEGGPTFDCDPVLQTGCDVGEKCTAVLVGGSATYACVVDPATLDVFDPCVSDPNTGVDGCPAGSECLADELDTGVCLPLCLEDANCGGGRCVENLVVPIEYCADACSPFEDTCPTPLQCRASGDRFTCRFAHETDVGGQAEACFVMDDAGCGEGFVCIPGELVPGCADASCCTTVCDTADGFGCDTPASCEPLFGAPSPGYEDVGACFVPA